MQNEIEVLNEIIKIGVDESYSEDEALLKIIEICEERLSGTVLLPASQLESEMLNYFIHIVADETMSSNEALTIILESCEERICMINVGNIEEQ